MLSLTDVHAGYGRSEVLHGVSLEVREGEVVCLVGRNGAGKSSTMRAVVQDLIRVTAGQVRFDGSELAGRPPHEVIRIGIGYVPEDRRVFAGLTVAENLSVPPPRLRGGGRGWTLADVFDLFPKLAELRQRPAGVLSGGEQQMLSIARSLLTNPRLLLLDEPHEGLAPVVSEQVIAAINRLKAEGVSMLVSEQQIRLISECADRVYVIDKGVTVFEGSAKAFERDPEVARKYLMVVQ